jgi:exosome complex component RRP41
MPVLIPEENPEQLFRKDGKRLDGREVDELRPFSCKIGVLENAEGSAYVEMGGNKIIAGVYGPRDVHPRHLAKLDRGILRIYYRMATFSVHERKSPAPNRREREISTVIGNAIEPTLFLALYPDSQIEVFVEVMAANGGTRCASTTAVSLALADAGIPMKSLVAGVAAGKINGKVVLDLSDKEDKAGDADIPAAIQMTDGKITLLQFDGLMTPDELKQGLEYIEKGAKIIFKSMLDAIKEKFAKIQENVAVENKEIEILKEKEEKLKVPPVKKEVKESKPVEKGETAVPKEIKETSKDEKPKDKKPKDEKPKDKKPKDEKPKDEKKEGDEKQ